jgi:ADP-heptose:LPS heptosyltransferase
MIERLFFLVSWILWRVVFARRPAPDNPRAILVIKLDHIGDGILATPVFENLRRHFPNARIDVLCARWNRAAFAGNPHLGRLMEFNPRAFRRDGRPCDAAARKWRALSAMRGEYDLTLSLRGTWLTLLLARKCWVDRGALRVATRLSGHRPAAHETDGALGVLERVGIAAPHRLPAYYASDTDGAAVIDLLQRLGIDDDARLVALHVGSPVTAKRWMPMRFARLGDRLADAGYTVLLVGAIMEEPLIVDVQGLAQSRLVGLAGMTTFPQTAALLGRCSGFVGNDSAPHHLAAAVGIPTVGLFFTTDPVRFGARGKHVRLLTARDPRSMEVDAVYDAVAELMAEAGRQ